MLAERTFDTGELTISYAEGPTSGPPVVLLHGLTMNKQDYQVLIPHLTPDWHFYACDQRGHGRSGRVAGRYLMADYIADTIAFLLGRVAEPAIIIGHSLGGLVALGVAAEAPELVRALILLDPALKVWNTKLAGISQYEWFAWVYDTVRSPRTHAEMVERCRAIRPEASEAELQEFVNNMFSLSPDALQVWIEDREMEGYDLEGVMRQVQAPTLILYGQLQPESTVRAEDAELAQSTLVQGVLVCVPDAGHMVHEEQTDFVLKRMQAFLRSV